MKLPTYRFTHRRGPEWGSGGVFGLKYHEGVLYFTLAFEAEAHFIRDGGGRRYRYELVGPEPRSGGDTYNAVEAVDGRIFFGGWVHAPATYRVEGGCATMDFRGKYSHVHVYDVSEDSVKLLWRDGAGLENEWVGEVSSIIYDPLNDRLLISRGDGMRSLGVYGLNPNNGGIEQLSSKPSIKGVIHLDSACFDISLGLDGVYGIQCLDLIRNTWSYVEVPKDLSRLSVDGGGVVRPMSVGSMASAYGRLLTFVKGGVLVWDPYASGGESLYFIRLFDFVGKDYGPLRTNSITLGGGVLTPFNAYTHGALKNPSGGGWPENVNYVVGPSTLVYITPPQAKVVASLGARVTSIEHLGNTLILGANTIANLGAYDVMPYDVGVKDIILLNVDEVFSRGSEFSFKVSGSLVGTNVWGGIPLSGCRRPRMLVKASKDNKVKIFEYDFSFPPTLLSEDVIDVKPGKNELDLSGYRGITSFKFYVEDLKLTAYLTA